MTRTKAGILFFCGATLAFAFPPFYTGVYAIAALVPLFYYISTAESLKNAAITGYIWGFGWACSTLFWVSLATVRGGIALLFYAPLFIAVFSFLLAYGISKKGYRFILMAPFIWTAIEFYREQTDLAFPWLALAYTQTYYTKVIQMASITSLYGVSFLIVVVNVLIYFAVFTFRKNLKNRMICIISALTVLIIPWLYGTKVLNGNKTHPAIKAAIVQPNISGDEKWDRSLKNTHFIKMMNMTMRAAYDPVDLIIWPETATANYIRYSRSYLRKLSSLIDSLNTPLLTGTLDYRFIAEFDTSRPFNSAILIQPNKKQLLWYDKLKLVPFSERVPFEDLLPFLQKLELGESDFVPGKKYSVFYLPKQIDGLRKKSPGFSVMICYDSIFSEVGRRFVRNGADFLVIITNDSWFGKTSGPYQHAQYAVYRAVENRVGIARCGNTGVSCFIDPWGRMTQQTELFRNAVISGSVQLYKDATFFNKYGHLITYIICGIAIIGVVSVIPEKRIQ